MAVFFPGSGGGMFQVSLKFKLLIRYEGSVNFFSIDSDIVRVFPRTTVHSTARTIPRRRCSGKLQHVMK